MRHSSVNATAPAPVPRADASDTLEAPPAPDSAEVHVHVAEHRSSDRASISAMFPFARQVSDAKLDSGLKNIELSQQGADQEYSAVDSFSNSSSSMSTTNGNSNVSSGKPSAQAQAQANGIAKANERIKELEFEVFELKKKLDRAESRLLQPAGPVGSSSREVTLEKDLDYAHTLIAVMKKERKALEQSVNELQNRLTAAETANAAAKAPSSDVTSLEATLMRGELQKKLEMQLLKAKDDKDKAIRLIIHLIGKERVNEFIAQHAGSADILDSMLKTFSMSPNQTSANQSANKLSSSSKLKTSKSAAANKNAWAVPKSRIDDYFRQVIVKNSDY